MIEIVKTRDIAADISRVWQLYTDHEGWARWAGLGPAKLIQTGQPQRDGVGAVRAMGLGGLVREEITEFVENERMRYRICGGPMPMRDHDAEVIFEKRGERTRVTWRARFRPMLPFSGWWLKLVVERIFETVLTNLSRKLAAER